MATYVKTLVDRDGNVILPKTRSTAIYLNDNNTLQTHISNLWADMSLKLERYPRVLEQTDFNLVLKEGLHEFQGTNINTPMSHMAPGNTTIGTTHYFLLVLHHMDTWLTQVAFDVRRPVMHKRRCHNGNWTEWSRCIETSPTEADCQTTNTDTTTTSGMYTKLLNIDATGNFANYSCLFIARDINLKKAYCLFALEYQSSNTTIGLDKLNHLGITCLCGSNVGLDAFANQIVVAHNGTNVSMWYKSNGVKYCTLQCLPLNEMRINCTYQWLVQQGWTNTVPTGTLYQSFCPLARTANPVFSGTAKVVSNTNYTTSQLRNTLFSTAVPSSLANGEICLVYQ